MFFSLSKSLDKRFQNHKRINQWWFAYDNGWTINDESCFKGYYYPEINHGNFLQIKSLGDTIVLEHDVDRSFPLWWCPEQQVLTNLIGKGKKIWADQGIELNDETIVEKHKDVIGLIESTERSIDSVTDFIVDNLISKSRSLAIRDSAKKLFVSGGIDTLTLYALLKNQEIPFELIDYEHFEYDWFTNQNISDIKRDHWAYRQLNHWKSPTCLISGACGDEFMFRGPATIAIWAAWHDTNLIEMLEKSRGYHVHYFLLEKNQKIFKAAFEQRRQIKERFPTKPDLIRHIIDMNANDHQHWHLGNTLTWTPFKDLSLTKLMLSLDFDSLIEQIADAKVSKTILERLDPTCLRFLSDDKNFRSRRYLDLLPGYNL